ncbi:MAG: ABC transporter permease [Chloroflexota bacterium]|nr:ABC transporter permease [Chloroflexota bacterium]
MVSKSHRHTAILAVIRRLIEGVGTAWAAVTFAFFALRFASGDPVASLLSQGLASPEQAEEIRISLGLNAPLWLQYLRFLANLLQGDLGTSLYTHRSVSQIIFEQFPSTAALAISGLIIALIFGFTLGITAAWFIKRTSGMIAAAIAALATSIPVAFTGILSLLIVGQLQLGSSNELFIRLFLPALVLGFASSGPIARVIHSGLSESLRSPFILAARARGIHRGSRLLRHALRPSLAPVISLIALEAAFLFSGTVVTETVFSRPGLGRLLVKSILDGDYPITLGLVALAAILYTFSHVFADLLTLVIDPRLRRAE